MKYFIHDFAHIYQVKWRQVCPDFLVRTLKACWENEERVICQFHYTTWPDHGVPNSVQPILELVRLIRDCQASEAVPVLIHCRYLHTYIYIFLPLKSTVLVL